MSSKDDIPKEQYQEPTAISKSPAIDSDLWSATAPYLPGVIIDTIRSHPDRSSPWIDYLEGSLLLADISGFTTMTEKLAEAGKEGAEWLTDIINQYFHRMLDIAGHYGGTNLNFGGDALLILFQRDDHALRAVAAALAMQRATRQFDAFRVGGYRIRLKMTVGVHSGNFCSAAAGLSVHLIQHFILGPDTNRVGEIQAAASAGELVISESTVNQVGGMCVTEPRGENYFVRRLRTNPTSPAFTEEGNETLSISPDELIDFLPAPIAQQLRSSRQVRSIEGEHRKVTIMFINLLGINELLAEEGPESLLRELQQYLALLLRLCDEHVGFISGNDIYTQGLKLILLFGAPIAHEDDAANALIADGFGNGRRDGIKSFVRSRRNYILTQIR